MTRYSGWNQPGLNAVEAQRTVFFDPSKNFFSLKLARGHFGRPE